MEPAGIRTWGSSIFVLNFVLYSHKIRKVWKPNYLFIAAFLDSVPDASTERILITGVQLLSWYHDGQLSSLSCTTWLPSHLMEQWLPPGSTQDRGWAQKLFLEWPWWSTCSPSTLTIRITNKTWIPKCCSGQGCGSVGRTFASDTRDG